MELQGVKVPFKKDYRDLTLEQRLDHVEAWAKEEAKRASIVSLVAEVRLRKNVVMNSLSHSEGANIPEAEVSGAINIVEKLIEELGKRY